MYALQGRMFSRLKKMVIQKCRILTVVSRALQQEALKLGVNPAKVKVIPMGVDLKNTFVPDPDIKRSDHELLFVGRLVEKKGVEVLIKAMPKIIASRPETRLTIAGAGPLEDELNSVLKKSLSGWLFKNSKCKEQKKFKVKVYPVKPSFVSLGRIYDT